MFCGAIRGRTVTRLNVRGDLTLARREGLPTVRYCPLGAQESGKEDRQDAGDSGSCPMKTGPAPDFV